MDPWEYSVDFHNAVNQRTGKLVLSYDEALAALRYNLGERGADLDRVATLFLPEFWHILWYSTHLHAADHQLLQFFRTCLSVFPCPVPACVSEEWDRLLLLGANTSDGARELVLALHNAAAPEFGALAILDADTFHSQFTERFLLSRLQELDRALGVRKEDQRLIGELKQQLRHCQTTPSDPNPVWVYLFFTTLGLLCLLFAWVLLRKRRSIRRPLVVTDSAPEM